MKKRMPTILPMVKQKKTPRKMKTIPTRAMRKGICKRAKAKGNKAKV